MQSGLSARSIGPNTCKGMFRSIAFNPELVLGFAYFA